MHGSFVNEFKRSRKNGKLRGCPEKKSRGLKGFKIKLRKFRLGFDTTNGFCKNTIKFYNVNCML